MKGIDFAQSKRALCGVGYCAKSQYGQHRCSYVILQYRLFRNRPCRTEVAPFHMTDRKLSPLTPVARGMASAGMWAVGGKLTGRLFDLATLIILTSILEPADFGLVAKAMAVVMLIEVITFMPIENSILRVKVPQHSLYETAFTLTLIRAVIIFALVAILAGPLALFFKDLRLQSLMLWLALAPALRGCISPKMADFTRQYDMRHEAAIDIASKLAALVAVTVMALMTRSYWSIAVGTILTPLVMSGLSYIVAPFRPRLTLKNWHAFKDVMTWVTISQTVQAMNWQLDNFILGRMLGNDAFGRFSIARQLNDIPFQAIALPLTRPMIAAFSAATHDEERRSLWLRFSNACLFIVGPVLVAVAVFSEDLIFVLLGQGWDGAGPIMAGLALATLPALPIVPLLPFAVSIFHTRLVAMRVTLQFLVSVPALITGATLAGVHGVIIAKAIIAIVMLFYVAKIIRDKIHLSIRDQMTSHWRSLFGLVVLAMLLTFARDLVPDAATGSRLLLGLILMVLGVLCLVAYAATCVALWGLTDGPESAETYVWGMMSKVLGKRD